MSIKGYTEETFRKQLNQCLSASGPIKSIQHLLGREKEIELIDEALSADGRHVFIYGDRGVGKTSLAATAAGLYQSSDNSFIQIGCGPDTKFYQTIEDLTDRVIKKASGKRKYDISHSISAKFYTINWKKESHEIAIPEINSMYTAVEALEEVCKYHSESPVIVIDEFDQIESEEERRLFSIYLKDLGDRGVNIKLILTGVGSSLTKLLVDHQSSFRQLHTIELKRLYWSSREEIVKKSIESFGLTIDSSIPFQISKISNGFPYFVHLLTEKLLWVSFKHNKEISNIDNQIFDEALQNAISSIAAHLQLPYDKATQHRSNDYREILWATADSESFIRYTDNVFSSYLRINSQLHGKNPVEKHRPLERKKFTERLGKLKTANYGNILENVNDRRGMYSYKENILRGFVAMKALEAGIELQGDIPDEPKKPTAMARQVRQYSAGKDYTPNIRFRGEKNTQYNE